MSMFFQRMCRHCRFLHRLDMWMCIIYFLLALALKNTKWRQMTLTLHTNRNVACQTITTKATNSKQIQQQKHIHSHKYVSRFKIFMCIKKNKKRRKTFTFWRLPFAKLCIAMQCLENNQPSHDSCERIMKFDMHFLFYFW